MDEPPRTRPPEPAAPAAPSLDEQILAAEARLVQRERRVRRQLGALGASTRAALRPRRWLMPALGVGVGAVVLWWAWRPRREAARPTRTAPPAHGGVLKRLAMWWPLLPPPWRAALMEPVWRMVERTFERKPVPASGLPGEGSSPPRAATRADHP